MITYEDRWENAEISVRMASSDANACWSHYACNQRDIFTYTTRF